MNIPNLPPEEIKGASWGAANAKEHRATIKSYRRISRAARNISGFSSTTKTRTSAEQRACYPRRGHVSITPTHAGQKLDMGKPLSSSTRRLPLRPSQNPTRILKKTSRLSLISKPSGKWNPKPWLLEEKMEEDRLPTSLLVSAQIRAAAQDGVSLTVAHKGDPDNGTILLKINLLNGYFKLLREIRTGKGLAWTFACAEGEMPEDKADAYLEKELRSTPTFGSSKSKTVWDALVSPAKSSHRPPCLQGKYVYLFLRHPFAGKKRHASNRFFLLCCP